MRHEAVDIIIIPLDTYLQASSFEKKSCEDQTVLHHIASNVFIP